MDSTPTKEYRQGQVSGFSSGPIMAAKNTVSVIDLADRLCGPDAMRRYGARTVARCPLPGHDDRSPSFTVYLETNSWWCFGCLRGGDVVDLAAAAWSYGDDEMAMAAANLLHEFNHPLPPRPAAWHARKSRQQPARDALDHMRVERVRRRLMRWVVCPELETIPDSEERESEADIAWRNLLPIARQIVSRVQGGGP